MIADDLVCVLPDGFEMSEESWLVIHGEWKARRERGWRGMLSQEEVFDLFSHEPQTP